jgi:hypothetical protein
MCAIQNKSDHANVLSPKGFDRQQSMIDSAQPGSSNDDNWKSQVFDQAQHIVARRDGYLHAADSFDHHTLISTG